MPMYRYSAMDAGGQMQSSTLVATDPGAAALALLRRNLNPLRIEEAAEGAESLGQILGRLGRVRRRQVIIFLRMLAALLRSGITITESLSVLHGQAMGYRFRAVLEDIKIHIEGGVALSDALARYPRIFPAVAVNMVRAGETGGILEEALTSLVSYMEKRAALQRAILRAFIYPSVVLLVSVGVILFLVTFVIPRFLTLLQGRALPWNTQLMFDASQFILGHGRLLTLAVAASVLLLVLLFSVHESRALLDRYKVYLPLVGPVFRFSVIVQFTRTLASLLESGLPLVESLRLTTATVRNQAVKDAMEVALERIVSGDPLSLVVRDLPVFTGLATALFRVGEQSGSMDESAALLADIYEAQLEDRVATMSAMIEPVLIISLGGIVGFVAWSLVAGMLSLYS
ncbi:type II secretion system F family protein [Desulfuromonas thiophila]|nr:type II secretion system F family protein [Desulfuromonas thiophila]